MRNRPLFKTAVILLVALFVTPGVTFAQELRFPGGSTQVEPFENSVLFQNDRPQRDSLWNGMLIGAAIGVGVGMFILPYKICGSNDSECSTIVRGAIGLPVIAGSIGVGALVDGLSSRDHRVPYAQRRTPSRTYGVQATVRF